MQLGGHTNAIIFKDDIIQKKSKQPEYDFYQDLVDSNSKFKQENDYLRQFVPSFYGITKNDNGEKVLNMENLFKGREFGSAIDIKIGKITHFPSMPLDKQEKNLKKSQLSTSASLYFRYPGVCIKDKDGQILILRNKKDSFTDKAKLEAEYLLEQVFKSNGVQQVNKECLQFVINFIERLILFLQNHSSRNYVSTSILLVVDNVQNSYDCKWTDFANYEYSDQQDCTTIDGLQSLLLILQKFQ